VKVPRETPKSWLPYIYKGPQQIESLGSKNILYRGRRTLQCIGIGCTSASDTALSAILDYCHVSSVKHEPLISNGHINNKALGQKASDATYRTRLPLTRRNLESSQTAWSCITRILGYVIGCALVFDAYTT